jgi:hypothetical protein
VEPSPAERASAVAVDLAALVGLTGIALGAAILAPTDLGFDRAAVIDALVSWIPTTVPIGVIILAVTAADVAAGLVIARVIRGDPFARFDEALLQGFIAAVVKDVLLLGVLAGIGLFSQPILVAFDVVILAAGALRGRPILGPGAIPRVGTATMFGALVLAAWAAPVLLQLASPVVPFLDVLPNHVAPAEHLRTFGTLTHLTDTQSPIYGPSRIFLGYTALLGTITTIAGLPAGEALAGFILPSTLLVGLAAARLATAIGGRSSVPWVLLTFAMTTSAARLGDARATVVVLPLIAWSLATVADRLTRGQGPSAGQDPVAGQRPGQGVLVGLALGAAMLVHPVIGFLGVATVGLVALVAPGRVAELAVPALGTAAVVALPQAATMLGIALPPVSLAVAVVVGVAAGTALGGRASIIPAARAAGRVAAVGGALLGVVLAGPLVRAAVAGATPLLSVMELSLAAVAAAVLLRAPSARSIVLWAALAVGFGLATLTQLVPAEGGGLLGDALRFELPKTLHYWVPVFVALLAGGGLAALIATDRLPDLARGAGIVAFVGAAALPIRTTPIDAFHLGEHRLSETLSIALRWAGTGFWTGFPDSRFIVDGPRRQILEAVRQEIAAGRLGPDTPVLHVAGSFQQWVATPLGVFDGVTETDVTPDAVESIHTVGGRLHPLDDLAALLAASARPGGRTFGYVLFEPDPEALPPGIRDEIVAAGYEPIFANAQGELFRLRASFK